MKRKLSRWCKDVKKIMIDRDMDTSDLAAVFNWTRQYVASIINGHTYQREAVVKISRLFNLEIPAGSTVSGEEMEASE
ncbi:MAG: helix-turn-helix domain-containing protein [Lachnospiraceae bacterium]|nr:helix-turn-helix domain-containing protein [Lachnospiraceae bacterium]